MGELFCPWARVLAHGRNIAHGHAHWLAHGRHKKMISPMGLSMGLPMGLPIGKGKQIAHGPAHGPAHWQRKANCQWAVEKNDNGLLQ